MVPPNHPFLIGVSIINHPFWGTTIFGNIRLKLKIPPKWIQGDPPTHFNHQIGSGFQGSQFPLPWKLPENTHRFRMAPFRNSKKNVLNLPPPNKKMTFKKSNPTPLTVFQGKTWKNLPPPSHLALQKSQSPFEVALGASADRSLGSGDLGINPQVRDSRDRGADFQMTQTFGET